MKKIIYKKFKDLKVGDIVYIVEVSNIDVQLKTITIRDIDTEIYGCKENPWFYFGNSPLSYIVDSEKSNWCNMIFSNKSEALKSAKDQINKKIKYFGSQIILFSDYLENIDNIEFKKEID